MNKPRVIRAGDVVRVVRPVFVRRVGYPKTVKDYLTQDVMRAAEDFIRKFDPDIPVARRRFFDIEDITTKDMHRITARVAQDVAYVLAKRDKFGGTKRTLHTVEITKAAGEEFYVDGVRTAKTGSYYPPTWSQGFEESYPDWEPGGLNDEKTHRLLRVSSPFLSEFRSFVEPLEIERENVVFVKSCT